MFSQHADDGIPDSIVKIIRGAAMEIGDTARLGDESPCDQLRIPVAKCRDGNFGSTSSAGSLPSRQWPYEWLRERSSIV